MRKQWLVLSALALAIAACSDNPTAPTPRGESPVPAMAAGGLGSNTRIMPLRGARTATAFVCSFTCSLPYRGGPIIPDPKVAVMYWGTGTIYNGGPAPGTTGTGAQDGSLIGHFLRSLGGSPYFNINTTYFDLVGAGHTVANSVSYTQFWANDQNVPPSDGTPVLLATIQAEIARGFATGAWTYDPQTVYTVMAAGNTNLGGGFLTSYCALHGFFVNGQQLVTYAILPFGGQSTACGSKTGTPNNDPAADAEVNLLAHEFEEAVTDPYLSAWNSLTEENADRCVWTFGPTYNNGTGVANMNLGGRDFLIQQNWANAAGCVQSWTAPPPGTNLPPVAAFTPNCRISKCTFFAGTSTDDEGVVSYRWDFGDGVLAPASAVSAAGHVYATTGTFPVTLTVTDGGGLSNSVTQPVTITRTSMASFTLSCVDVIRTCTFDGSSSSSGLGGISIIDYRWDFGDGSPLGTGMTASHAYAAPGVYTVRLTVTTAFAETGSVTQTVTLTNQPPVAQMSYFCDNGSRTCFLFSSGSTDDVGIVSYGWDFGDGSAAGSGAFPTHVYAAIGTYQVTLTVTDGGGLTSSITKPVTVTLPQPPVADWTVSCQPTREGRLCTFDGTASFDPDGFITAYRWNKEEGNKVLSTAASFTQKFDESRSFTWTLTVTDNNGQTGKLTRTFTVP